MTRLRRLAPAIALPMVLGTAVLSGCGEDPDPAPTSAASSPATPAPDSPDRTTESESPSAPAPSASPTPPPLPDGPLATRFIDPAELPGLNDEWRWRDASTGHSEPVGFGRCAKFDVFSIGAGEALTRTYTEAGTTTPSGTAAMQLLSFPDAQTARRAAGVIESWRDTCQSRLPDRASPRVSPWQAVDTRAERGAWYLVTTTRPGADEGHFHAFGMTLSGNRMALLTMDNDGQDRNYEAGQDPMERAVAVAADRIR